MFNYSSYQCENVRTSVRVTVCVLGGGEGVWGGGGGGRACVCVCVRARATAYIMHNGIVKKLNLVDRTILSAKRNRQHISCPRLSVHIRLRRFRTSEASLKACRSVGA